MRSHALAALAAPALALALTPAVLAQQTVYAIGSGGSTLIRFQSNNPGAVTVVGTFGGDATFLDALDFRPATGQLYGYLDSADAFFTVNLNTGALTRASAAAPTTAPTNTFQLGLDFNPTIDRARLVTDSGQNIVFNPLDGTQAAFSTLTYAIGDANELTSPAIIDNAYTNNRPGATTSVQYAIDYGADVLVTLANNAGTLTTVGGLGVNTDVFTGFDIFTSDTGDDTAYAILAPANGTPSFYTINLATGAATLVGAVGASAGTQVYSLAVVPIPAPGAAVLGLTALLTLSGRRRR